MHTGFMFASSHVTSESHRVVELLAHLGITYDDATRRDLLESRAQHAHLRLIEDSTGLAMPAVAIEPGLLVSDTVLLESIATALTQGIVRKGLSMHMWAHKHISRFDDVNAIALSPHAFTARTLKWGQDIDFHNVEAAHVPGGIYADEWSARVGCTGLQPSLQEHGDSRAQQWTRAEASLASTDYAGWKVPELRLRAKELEIKPLPRKKDDLVEKIHQAETLLQAPARDILHWPAVFIGQDLLVLRADEGPLAHCLELLRHAIDARALAVGDLTEMFGSGLVLFDKRTFTPNLQLAHRQMQKARSRALRELMPVAKRLRRDGIDWWRLDTPRQMGSDGPPQYWLATRALFEDEYGIHCDWQQRGGVLRGHVRGWYTLQELREKRFLEDLV